MFKHNNYYFFSHKFPLEQVFQKIIIKNINKLLLLLLVYVIDIIFLPTNYNLHTCDLTEI